MSKENEDIPVTKICDRFSKSTVAYYKNRKARARLANKEDFILLLVRRERMVNPMSGCKKVLFAIRQEMGMEGVSMGVNRFYDLMRRNGILKSEYFLDCHFKTKAEARKAIAEAIWVCNHRRLHESLGYKTPVTFRAEWKEVA